MYGWLQQRTRGESLEVTIFFGTYSLKFVSFASDNCNMANLFFFRSVFCSFDRPFGGNFDSQQWPFLLVLISGAILTTQICHADAFHPGLSDGYDKIIYQRQYVLIRIFRTRFHFYVLIFTSAEQEKEGNKRIYLIKSMTHRIMDKC